MTDTDLRIAHLFFPRLDRNGALLVGAEKDLAAGLNATPIGLVSSRLYLRLFIEPRFAGNLMFPIVVALIAFGLALVGILLGGVMQKMLPEGHLTSESKEVVKLSMGVVATLAALVLGLLVASAKNTYDAREIEINQITAYVILLDNLLAKYGDGSSSRASLATPGNSSRGRKNLERSAIGAVAVNAIQGCGGGRSRLSADSGASTKH